MAHPDPKEAVLAKVSLFSGLSAKELHAISSLLTPVDVPAGTVLTREGDHGREFIVIVTGTASVSRHGTEVATIGPGASVGEIAIIDGGPRTATVTATTDMQIEVATHAEFSSLLAQAPEIAVNLLPTLARRVRDSSDSPTH